MTQIKRIQKEQIPQVAQLWLNTASAIKAHSFIEPSYWADYRKTMQEMALKNVETFALFEDEALLGFSCVDAENGIDAFFIDPAHQRRGLGRELMSFLQSEYAILHLNVYAENKDALFFYTSQGFLIDGATYNATHAQVEYTMLWNE